MDYNDISYTIWKSSIFFKVRTCTPAHTRKHVDSIAHIYLLMYEHACKHYLHAHANTPPPPPTHTHTTSEIPKWYPSTAVYINFAPSAKIMKFGTGVKHGRRVIFHTGHISQCLFLDLQR